MVENKDMEELKEGWRRVKLENLGEIVSGGTPKTSMKEYWNGKVAWLTPKDFSNQKNKYWKKGERSITDEGLKNSSAKLMPKGTVLFTSRAPIGYVGIADREVSTNQGFKNIIANKENSNEFIYYLLKYITPNIESIAGGSTFKEISASAFKNIEVEVPDLETQEKIATILSALDDKIELNNEMNKTLEEMAQTLFKRWFIDFDFPNENGEPYRSSGGKMVDSELGEIPEGWRIGSLEEVIDKIIDNRGKTPPRTEVGIPLIEGNNIFLNETTPILNSKQKYVSEETYSSWFRAGHPEYLDILCATVGTLPKWCFTPKNTKICIAQNIIAIRSNDLISPYYLKMYIDTENFIKRFEGRIIATAQPSIKVGHLTSLSIIIPIKKVINDFDKIIKNIFKKREKNQQEIQSLIEIRDTLLPKLMSGEVEI